MKEEFNLLEPRNVEEAIRSMKNQSILYDLYLSRKIPHFPEQRTLCQKYYLKSRELAIKFGGLEAVENFPDELR